MPDSELFSLLSKFPYIKEDDLKIGKITLLNSQKHSIQIDIADVFIFNYLIIHQKDRSSTDIYKIAYKAETARDLHSLIIYLSSKFPKLVYHDINDMAVAFETACRIILSRREHEIAGKEEHLFYVEQFHDNTVINITCDSDCFLKIDMHDRRILFIFNRKIAIFSLHFLNEKWRTRTTSAMYDLLISLGIEERNMYDVAA